MDATEAKNTLEGYKLARFRIMKSGYATEQDPFPVSDPITGKPFDMKLGKEYLMPKYMAGPLGDCYRPMYETVRDAHGNAVMDHKSKTILPLNFRMDELHEPKEDYLKEHPEAELLFSVDPKLVASVSKLTSATSTKSTKKADETTA